ncbi:MAG: 4-(cytidine 5'-diphospho)-2-C-methyl-D-erythritol kinase [Neisseria sp.]|nr:4-(cytidine 5'-diphospho)-2-C-methyl-D-erythritol kinase [Neisseria sp.]
MTACRPPATARAYPAPAKLNLMLKIIGRRTDGYHLLETVFTLIDLCDTVYLQTRDDGQIVLHNPQADVSPEQDLTVRAARALQNASGSLKGTDIWLDKVIPVGGGLGGGSSDAATVLLVLNHLWQCRLSRRRLMDIALTLGADVPFFVFGQNAFAQGVGERLSALNLPPQHYVVVHPPVHVSTAHIFQHPRLTRNSQSCIIHGLENNIPHQNDLQAVVTAEYQEVAAALDLLRQYGEAQMTGSGACVFLATKTRHEAENIAQAVSGKYPSFCTSSLSRHPLYDLAVPDGESSSG